MATAGSRIKITDIPKIYQYNGTIGTAWSGSTAPFTQTITINGILSTDQIITDIVPSATFTTAQSQIENYRKIYRITAANNLITCYATEKTTVNIPIQLMVIREQTT